VNYLKRTQKFKNSFNSKEGRVSRLNTNSNRLQQIAAETTPRVYASC